jgi:hypothetical protein
MTSLFFITLRRAESSPADTMASGKERELVSIGTALSIHISDTNGCLTFQRLGSRRYIPVNLCDNVE